MYNIKSHMFWADVFIVGGMGLCFLIGFIL